MTFLRLRALVLLILSLALCACGQDEVAKRINLSERREISVNPPDGMVTYAYLPQYAHTVSYERHRDLLDYLANATGLSFRQVYPDTFDAHMKMVAEGKIDISFTNPFVYVKMAEKRSAFAFARIIEPSGWPFFRGQIIARADNAAVRTLADCKGKRWIAVDPSSTGGYLLALGHFYQNGIKKSDFAEIAFAPGPGGKQENVVMAVYSGRYDIGSVREGTLPLLADKIDLSRIKVVDETKPYPGWLFAARTGFPPDKLDRIRKALFALDFQDPAQRTILERAGMRGIITAEDKDFQPIRDLMRTLNMDKPAGD